MARYFRTIGHVYGESDDYGPAFSQYSAGQPPGAGFVPPTDGTAANGKPIYSWDEAAAQLTRINLQWSAGHGQGAVVTYAFRESVDPSLMPDGATGFQQFTSAQIVAANEALALWADVANITFVRVGTGTTGAGAYSNNATILFGDFTGGFDNSTGFTFYPGNTAAGAVQGDVWINLQYTENLTDLANGGFGAHTLEHELGHAIGLAHPGDYDSTNGGDPTYDADAIYWQDSRAFTDMSYFGSTGVGFSLGSFSSGPQLHDIAAAQLLYGPNMTTRTGDTVYGFNSNTGHDHYSIASSDDKPVFSIWDAGGHDTLDLSGYSTNSEIDLRPESFSSAGLDSLGGPAIGNISIARGATIEDGIGGAGNDTITGNDVANHLTGNGGNDILNGGLGIDTSNYASASTSDSWHRNPDGSWTIVAGAEGVDTLSGVEFAHFTDRDVHLAPARETFSGDGTSDILFRGASGEVVSWNVNGSTVTSTAFINTLGSEWSVQTTGDFNGDGHDDILWRRADGLTYIWEMNGGAIAGAAPTSAQPGLDWHIQGAGDFNGDGRDDILWRNDSGVTYLWQMDTTGFGIATAAATSLQPGTEWSVSALGDFNGDGKEDILWRNTQGVTVLWQMDGANVVASATTAAQPGLDWTVAGTGDFNGDGRDDILWRNDSGLTYIWEMNGATIAHAAPTSAQPGLDWQIAGVGDYNGDGKDDILWRNDSLGGLVYVWMMDGETVTQAGALNAVGDHWVIPGG